MPHPGIADPYWFEWYVGLKYVIDMINPDSKISGVTFQHESYSTIDDVVVEYNNGTIQMCYQIKHEIATSQSNNLTFGKLLEKDKNGKILFQSLFQGWKEATLEMSSEIKPILYTNRKLLNRRAGRNFNGNKYSAYPVDRFLLLMQDVFKEVEDYSNLIINDSALLCQWQEFCAVLNIDNDSVADVANFLQKLTIKANQLNLDESRQELISKLAFLFCCKLDLADELFGKLVVALQKWTTTSRKNAKITREEVYSVLGKEVDVNESQHQLAPPFPFFGSRQAFCKTIERKIRETNKKIILLSGDPGSGKTSTISYLQSTSNLFFLRYHAFRPISPEQRFYDADPGICRSENLWGTFLIQLRQKLKGKLAEYGVPISNKLLTLEETRHHVCRLLGRLANESEEGVYVCIDGIDHAARANNMVTFLTSLPHPSEIPEGVCFVIVGQPIRLYQAQYPVWLSDEELIEYLDMPKLRVDDIGQLIMCKLPQFQEAVDGLARYVYERTEGNNLSAVFAIEEIKNAASVEDAIEKLSASRITADIQQYYCYIWNYMKTAILNMNLPFSFPEIVIACSILLINGRIETKLLSVALRCEYGINEAEWKQILDRLYPLIIPYGGREEYAIFHNDFRIFLMGAIHGYEVIYKHVALILGEYLLQNESGLLTYVSGIPLLQSADRTDLVPAYFTAEFVVNALAEGVSKDRLNEFLQISYKTVCDNQDFAGYVNAYLAAKTLYQNNAYFEYYERDYIRNDYPEINAIDYLEVCTLPLLRKNLNEYGRVLILSLKLTNIGTKECVERASALYARWFEKLSPYSFVDLCSENDVPEDEAWKFPTSDAGKFLRQWGEYAAELNVVPPVAGKPESQKELYALVTFGEAYFVKCIELHKPDMAIAALQNGFVSKDCFAKKLEDILYGGFVNKFKSFLSQIEFNSSAPSEKLLAMAMQVIYQPETRIEKEQLTPLKSEKHIHDVANFTAVLRSFLLGYLEGALDDIVILGHVNEFYSFLEGGKNEKEQLAKLVRLAALLGKSYSKSGILTLDTVKRYVDWFLTASLRRIDYSKAHRFLLFVLLRSPYIESVKNEDWLLEALKTQLFEIGYIGAYYKTDILDYMKLCGRLDIIREYIQTLYGEDCGRISTEENKADIHKVFMPYGEIVVPKMMKDFSDRLKWDVVGYVGHKECAMQSVSEVFEIISTKEPLFWRDAIVRLYKQSKIAAISDNRYENEICENIVKAAVCCGISDFWDMRYYSTEFCMDPSLIEYAILGFVQKANDESDLEALWLLNCGIHSWYTQEDRLKSKGVYDSCCSRALDLGINFRNIVERVTPQWLNIIDYESINRDYRHNENNFAKQYEEELAVIRSGYDEVTIETLLALLPDVPMLDHVEKRYELIVSRLIAENLLTTDNANCLLDSLCCYIADNEWVFINLDSILDCLLPLLGENAFWKLAVAIGSHLCDYDCQASSNSMRDLLKLYCKHDLAQMKALFEKELLLQEQWVTGNNRITVAFTPSEVQRNFEVPLNFAEMALYILIEQLGTLNARKIESAIFAIYKLGKSVPCLLEIVALNWNKITMDQKEFILPVIVRWIYDGMKSKQLFDIILKDYINCSSLYFKYYYHSMLVRLKVKGIDKERLTFEAPAKEYTLKFSGEYNKNSSYERFLSLVEQAEGSVSSDDIRGYIASLSDDKQYKEDEYGKICDLKIPALEKSIDNVLYDVEKSGRWEGVSLLHKKSMLIPLEDPFLLTDMPQIIYDEKWFPDASRGFSEDMEKVVLNRKKLSDIVRMNIKSTETMLAACVWYPWNYKDGTVFYELSQIKSVYDLSSNDQNDYCIGNFGLLIYDGEIEETNNARERYNAINLFDIVRGNIKISFGNGQIVPSSAWRKVFCCEPSDESPYRWIDESGVEVLRFERIASPIRNTNQKAYTRQPILFRWIVNTKWFEQKLEELSLRTIFITSCEEIPF